MASGFLFFYSKKNKKGITNIKDNIKKRSKRLLLPYLFVGILWVIPFYIFFNKYDYGLIFRKYFLMISPSQLWFLITLFAIYCFFEIFYKWIKINKWYLILVYLLSFIGIYIVSHYTNNYFQTKSIVKYLPYFYLGGYLYEHQDSINLKKIIYMLIIWICLIISTKALIEINSTTTQYLIIFIYQIISSIKVCIIYYISTILVSKIKLNCKLYKLFEENSFGIYLFHQQFICILAPLLKNSVSSILQVIILFTVSIIGALVLSLILKKIVKQKLCLVYNLSIIERFFY